MDFLYEYVNEGMGRKGWLTKARRKKLVAGLLIDDRERIKDINTALHIGSGRIPLSEDISDLFWRGAYKDRVDEYYGYITEWLKNIGLTPRDIIDAYSLARSGKQAKIDVIATVLWIINWSF